MTWSKTFREAYLDRFQSSPDAFDATLLRAGLHRRALPVAWLIRTLWPSFFALEIRTIRFLGNARSSEEYRAELDSYRSEYRRHGGFLRKALGVRLSGRRLMDILGKAGPESAQQGNMAAPGRELPAKPSPG